MSLLSLVFQLIVATSFSWARMFIALFLSVIMGLGLGIYIARRPRAEKYLLPVIDILQTLPILSFFPFAIFIIVYSISSFLGLTVAINAAVILLIVTSMLWNIIIGVYESTKIIPKEILEVGQLYKLTPAEKLRKIFIPAAMPKVVEQSILSWSIGLFYLVTSEIFSTGNANYQVGIGIGVEFVKLSSGPLYNYLLGIGIFVIFVILTRIFFFKPWEERTKRYTRGVAPRMAPQRFYQRIAKIWFGRFYTGGGFINTKIRNTGARIVDTVFVRRKRVEFSWLKSFSSSRIRYLLLIVFVLGFILSFLGTIRGSVNYEPSVLIALLLSFARIWGSYLLVLTVAIPLCVYLVFFSKKVDRYILIFQVISAIPATILLPLIAVAFKTYPNEGEIVAFVIFFLSGIWYVIFGMLASATTLTPNVFEVKKMFGLRGLSAWKNVYIKALLPGIITGSMTGIAAEWNASIVAEYFTSSGITGIQSTVITQVGNGIGKLLDNALGSNDLVLMAVAIINLIGMIIIINTVLWKRLYNQVSKVYR